MCRNRVISIDKLVEIKGKDCRYCGIETFINQHLDYKSLPYRAATRDHLIPLSKGGKNEVDNLVVSCNLCNRRKSDNDIETFLNSNWLKGRLRSIARLKRRARREDDLYEAFNDNTIYIRRFI